MAATVAFAILVASSGCGGAGGTTSIPQGTAVPVPETAEVTRFRALANDVCATVGQSGAALVPADPGARPSRRELRVAERVSRAMALSLGRLPAPEGVGAEVNALAQAYRELRRAYATVVTEGPDAGAETAGASPLRDAARTVQVRASTAGLPACGWSIR
jgi:hypothetical protein